MFPYTKLCSVARLPADKKRYAESAPWHAYQLIQKRYAESAPWHTYQLIQKRYAESAPWHAYQLIQKRYAESAFCDTCRTSSVAYLVRSPASFSALVSNYYLDIRNTAHEEDSSSCWSFPVLMEHVATLRRREVSPP
jgi:hypothetical protein